MGIESGNLDYWRNFFSNSNIFDVIEKGILIAASDRPTEFQRRRVRIAEMLFSCRTARCFNCNSVELQVPEHDYEDDKFRKEGEGIARDGGGCGKESKVNSSAGDDVGNNSYDEAEALTEEIEEENQIVAEVLRIKAVLSKQKNESNSVLFDSLRRLQLMRLSVETLQATEIGKAVNGLKKHDSKEICHLVRTLIEEWKVLVDDWVAAAPVIEESTPESTGPSSFDEDTDEGLPSPPLDEGAFLPAGQITSLEFSKFFDGMDDDGSKSKSQSSSKAHQIENPFFDQGFVADLRTYGKFNKNKEMGRRPLQENPNEPKGYDPSFPSINPEDVVYARTDDFISRKEKWQWDAHDNQSKSQVATINPPKRPQESLSRPLKSSVGDSGTCSTAPQKPSNLSKFFKSSNERKPDCQRLPAGVQKKHTSDLQDKSKNSDDNSVRAKLELAKRKLHERYQEAENAKKQRTIQVMELNDIPKKGSNRKQFLSKHGNFSQLPTSRWN